MASEADKSGDPSKKMRLKKSGTVEIIQNLSPAGNMKENKETLEVCFTDDLDSHMTNNENFGHQLIHSFGSIIPLGIQNLRSTYI